MDQYCFEEVVHQIYTQPTLLFIRMPILGVWDRVALVAVSEFGRTLSENGSGGTGKVLCRKKQTLSCCNAF